MAKKPAGQAFATISQHPGRTANSTSNVMIEPRLEASVESEK